MIRQRMETASFPQMFSARVLLAVLLIFQSVCVIAQSAVETDFLTLNANSDGSIVRATDLSDAYQSTAEAIVTFQALEQSSATAAENGRLFLNSVTVDSTEKLALKALVSPAGSAAFNTVLATVIERQNQDGGIGAFTGFGSDLLSTTYALRLLAQANVVNSVSSSAVGFLLAKQHAQGSWSVQDNPNQTETTALAVNALWLYRHHYAVGDALAKGVAYLAAQREPDHLWGGIEASALALATVLNVELDRTPYQDSLNAFASLQNSNHSFGDDVYLTALGLRVLNAAAKPAPDEIVLFGRVVDGDSGTPLSGALVQLDGVSSLSVLADSNGEFSLTHVLAGNYSVSVSIDGFGALSLNTLLTLGAKVDLGDLQLSRLQTDPNTGEPVTTGIVRGVITDRRTGAPLAGASVSVVGTGLSASTSAAGEYQLSAVPAGEVQLSASAAGYSLSTGLATLSAGQTLIFSPSLQEQATLGVSVQGTINDRLNGFALAGVEVQVTGGDNQIQTATTDAEGTYLLDNIVAGDISIRASAADYHSVSVTTTVEDGTRLTFSPQMDLLSQDPASTASGLMGDVIDAATGRGLEFVQLTLTFESGESVTQVSGADGEFVFGDLPQGRATITAGLAGYVSLSGSLELQSGLVADIGSVELQPENAPVSGSLKGWVIDVRSRQAINGALISARNTVNNLLVEAMSDAQGQFALPALSAGEYEVTVSFTEYVSQVFNATVTAGNELDLGEIRLRQPGVDALLADLAVISLNASALQSDQEDFSVSGTVSGVMVNRGNVAVSVPLTVFAFEDTDRDGVYSEQDTLLGTSTVSFSDTPLDVDSTAAFSVAVNGVQSFHDAPVSIFIDASNVIAELSETNNTDSTAGLCSNQSQGPSLDLALCMDSSGSVSSSEFRLQLEGTARAIENENIIPRDGSVRVSAIQFSSYSSVELNPTIIEEDNAEDVADAVRAIRKRGGGTSIHSCINKANSLITGASPASALQVIDVSTDGRSSQSAAMSASNNAQAAGIDVLNSIGIGNGVNMNLLNNIVFPQPSGGDRGFVIRVGNFQEYIDGIAGKIQRETRIADLTAGGLTLIDNGSGAEASATLVIGNGGSGDITGAITVRVYNGVPGQGGQLLVEQVYTNGLASGESATVTLDGIVPADISSGQLVADASLADGFVECNEDNNRQQIPVSSLLGDIGLTLNGTVFGSNQDIDLTTLVTNTGSLPGNYSVALTILAADRAVVDSVAAFAVADLAPTLSSTLNHLWNTGAYVSGNYIALAELSDVQGKLLGNAEAGFTISDLHNSDGTPNGNTAATVKATTDRAFYHVDDQVQLNALAENTTSIHPITSPALTLVVSDAAGNQVFSDTVLLTSLAPGQIASAVRTLTLTQAVEGVYQYQVTLTGNDGSGINAAIASATASFEVINDLNAAVQGNVTVQQPQLFQGQTQSCTFTTLNTGTQDLSGLAINYRVINVDTQNTVSAEQVAVDLAAGENTSQLQSFDTATMAPGHYACVLEARLNGVDQSLAYAQFEVLEQPLSVDAQLDLTAAARVLVLIDRPDYQETPDMSAQRAYLESFLGNVGISYRIVDNYNDYLAAVQGGQFTQTLVLAQAVDLGLIDTLLLNEAVNRAHSLIVANGATGFSDTRLSAVLGLRAGQSLSASGVAAFSSDLHNGGALSFSIDQTVPLVASNGAQVLTAFTGAAYQTPCTENCADLNQIPALTQQLTGQGRALYLGIDWLRLSTEQVLQNGSSELQAMMADLLINSYQAQTNTRPGAAVAVRANLNIEGSGPDLRAVFTFPSGSTVVDASQGEALSETQWQVSLDGISGHAALQPLWLKPAYTNSEALLVLAVFSGNDIVSSATLTVQAQPQEQLSALMNTLRGLSRQDRSLGAVLRFVSSAQQAIDAGDFSSAVRHLLDAAGRLGQSAHPQAAQLREQTDWIIWQTAQRIP